MGNNVFTYVVSLMHPSAMVTFFGALKMSKLIITSNKDVSGWAISIIDLRIMRNEVILTLGRSKTGQW